MNHLFATFLHCLASLTLSTLHTLSCGLAASGCPAVFFTALLSEGEVVGIIGEIIGGIIGEIIGRLDTDGLGGDVGVCHSIV